MKCKQARQALVLDYYNEISEAEKAELEAHLRTCRTCAAEREDTLRVFSLLEANPPAPVPEPDAERVWSRVEFRLSPKAGPERRRAWDGRQWSLAGAALVLVLVAGIFIGRGLFPTRLPVSPLASSASEPSQSASGLKSVLAGHLEDMKPLLLDYANHIPEVSPGRTVSIDENLLRALLLQNVLLRKALASSDPAAAELLDDCDLILKEILNQDRPTAASPGDIRDLILKRDVLFKLEILKKI
ncbi:MAG: zf-HC2 domain-containing protein [Candidatus Aminicenantes bacterium]|nr:zf-HC2 domain-containing protein [Candidatus Aminicenantes bacterium]